jgi:hypothetical protein
MLRSDQQCTARPLTLEEYKINVLLYNHLQYSVYNLYLVAKEFKREISTTKTKIMAFQSKEHIRSKFCIENTIFEQANNFNYLGYNLTYKGEIDVEKKLEKFNRALRIINQVFHPAQVRKHTRLSGYKTLARPVLAYGSEAVTIRKQGEQWLSIAEMKFMRRTVGYSQSDHMKNKHILDKMKITPITEC